MTITPVEARYLLLLMGRGEGSIIRPDPSFTAQAALARAERLKAEIANHPEP